MIIHKDLTIQNYKFILQELNETYDYEERDLR